MPGNAALFVAAGDIALDGVVEAGAVRRD